jgi:RNA polymerase sigma-70 factor (ECF subfamily)
MRGIDWRSLPVDANGQSAIAAYARGTDCYRAHTLQVCTVEGGVVAHTYVFQDTRLFEAFGLPLTL